MKVLILHTSVGGGHRSAALAIAEALEVMDSGGIVETRDVLEFTPAFFRKLYAESYDWLINHTPEVWGYLYEHGPQRTAERKTQQLVRAFDRLNYRRLISFLDRFRPDAVIATHFLPSELLLPLAERGEFKAPYWLVLTDHDAHALWVRSGPRGFFVGSEGVKVLLEAAGIEKDRIHVTGIPISLRFRHPPEIETAREELGLSGQEKVVLLMGGATGFDEMIVFAKALSTLRNTKILAVAGRNEELARGFDEIAAVAPHFVPFRFVERMEILMQASHVVVTKPGGLTTSECLAMGRPMVIVRPTPGQEERNADYLLEAGAAWKARTPEILRWKIERLWREPDQLNRLSQCARALGRPEAADTIARTVMAGQRRSV